MADHCVNIDAVKDPMELLGRKRQHRSLSAWPPELVFRQFLQDHHETGPIKKQELHPVVTAIAKGKHRRSKRVQRHRFLDQDREAVDAGPKVDRLAMQVDCKRSFLCALTFYDDRAALS
jgi:hypothetical protein